MKLAVVTPRYGADIAGGAETAARLVAANLAQRTDWTVEALTTCARDATTWADSYPPGAVTFDGVNVRRFPVPRGRASDFDRHSDRLFRVGARPSARDQMRWIDRQGPVSPQLVDAIAHSDADVVAFHPYLYHPTVVGLRAVHERAVLHPAAHDEAPIRLPLFREVFAAAAGLVYWSDPERRFVERQFATGARPQLVLGLGVDAAAGEPDAARARAGLDDRPYLLCLGRVDDGKGARVLAECFTAYKERRPGALQLVFAGPVVHPPAPHPDIVVLGAVDEDVKWGLLRGSLAFVTPSAYESFSIVLMEAWSVKTPALVNSRSAVTAEHAERSGGALAFATYAEFEAALDRVRDSSELRLQMGAAGFAYVERHYQWPAVTDRYDRFLREIVNRQG